MITQPQARLIADLCILECCTNKIPSSKYESPVPSREMGKGGTRDKGIMEQWNRGRRRLVGEEGIGLSHLSEEGLRLIGQTPAIRVSSDDSPHFGYLAGYCEDAGNIPLLSCYHGRGHALISCEP